MIRNACIIIAVIATIIISCLGASNNTEVPVAQNIEIDEDIDVQNSFDTSTNTEISIMQNTKVETKTYINDSNKSGPTVFIIAGIHGNEVAGIETAKELAECIPEKGRLIVLPMANKPAYENNLRTMQYMEDLNRNFPGNNAGNITQKLACEIVGLIDEYRPDVVIDLHESKDSYQNDKSRLGDTIIFTPNDEILDETTKLVMHIVDQYNRNLQPNVELTFLSGAPDGSINKEITGLYNIPVITVETNSKLELEERKIQHKEIVNIILQYYGIGALHKK